MTRYDRKTRIVAICLSALAGYVDAVGFLGTGGFFVSFMSGNSTRLGVGISDSAGFARVASVLVASFVLGVVVASLLARKSGEGRQRALLLLVAAALATAAGLADGASTLATFAIVAFGMGAVNMVFEADGEVRVGLTYMTGTLVKIGQRLAAALLGGDSWAWLPYLLLWLGLVAGTVAGAFAFARLGLDGLWVAAGAAAILAFWVPRLLAPGEPAPADQKL